MKQALGSWLNKAPQAIIDLEKTGVKFSNIDNKYDLTTEGAIAQIGLHMLQTKQASPFKLIF